MASQIPAPISPPSLKNGGTSTSRKLAVPKNYEKSNEELSTAFFTHSDCSPSSSSSRRLSTARRLRADFRLSAKVRTLRFFQAYSRPNSFVFFFLPPFLLNLPSTDGVPGRTMASRKRCPSSEHIPSVAHRGSSVEQKLAFLAITTPIYSKRIFSRQMMIFHINSS